MASIGSQIEELIAVVYVVNTLSVGFLVNFTRLHSEISRYHALVMVSLSGLVRVVIVESRANPST